MKVILGLKWKDDCYVILIMVYVIMFLIGFVGNVFICVVIVKNVFMYIVINLYLMSLVLVDFFIFVLGMYMRSIIIFFCMMYILRINDKYVFFLFEISNLIV